MREITLFAEDYAHEAFLAAFVERIAVEQELRVHIRVVSAQGGRGRAVIEFRRYVRDVACGRVRPADLIIAAIDANCKKPSKRIKEIEKASPGVSPPVICAVPDPHIERWLLVDSAAFKKVMGRGCRAPDKKCGRDRYKEALLHAMKEAGISPPLGGVEYADDIVRAMELERVQELDHSLGRLLQDLRRKFREWRGP